MPTTLPPPGGSEFYGDAAIYDEAAEGGAPGQDMGLYGGDDATYGDLPQSAGQDMGVYGGDADAYGDVDDPLYDDAHPDPAYDTADGAMGDLSLYGDDSATYDTASGGQ